MADGHFFPVAGPFSLQELSDVAGAKLADISKANVEIMDVAPLSTAGKEHISFLDNKRYIGTFEVASAGACIVHPDYASRAPAGMALLLTDQPYHVYARIARAFHPTEHRSPGVHSSADIGHGCEISEDAQLGPGVCVHDGVSIGANTAIGANTVIEKGVVVGVNCTIGPNVTLQYCIIGAGVYLHPGVRIGQDGFGFAMGAGGHEKVPQLGRVIVEDDVEIGANTTIDRGAGPDTIIGQGTKIDNLVQLGHNVQIGKGCIIVSQVGISGSTEVGDYTVIGGQVGIAGHLKIGKGVQIAAKSGIMRNVEDGSTIGGSPARPMKEWLRSVAAVERMGKKR